MRIATAIPIATLTVFVFVSNLAMCPVPDEQQGPGAVPTLTEPPLTPPTQDDPVCLDPFDFDAECNAPQSDVVKVEKPCDDHAYKCGPVLDLDYDDSWVVNVPDLIGGYRVLHISTPKDRVCSNLPMIGLQTSHGSLDEFLSAPLDIGSLRAALQAIGVPSDVRLSFSRGAFDKETWAERRRIWNEGAIEIGGCIQFGRIPDPDLP